MKKKIKKNIFFATPSSIKNVNATDKSGFVFIFHAIGPGTGFLEAFCALTARPDIPAECLQNITSMT